MSRRNDGPFAIYTLTDPRDGYPFYAGYSCDPSARFKAHASDPGSSAWRRSRQIIEAGLKPEMNILLWVDTKQEAKDIEACVIRGLDSLVNLTRHPLGCSCGLHGITGIAKQVFNYAHVFQT